MSKFSLVLLVSSLLLVPFNSAYAQSGSSEAFGSGVHQYFSGRHQEAINSLTTAISGDSKDARAYYFRGLAKMGSGDSYGAESDFELGAAIEAKSSKRPTSLVTRSLERVQGGLRLKLEKTRRRVFDGGLKIESTSIASSLPVHSPSISTVYHSDVVPFTSGPVVYDSPVLPSLPIVSEPIVSTPIVTEPIVSSPIVSSPIVSEPIVSEPIVSAPIVSAPIVSSPIISSPIVSTPIEYQAPQVVFPQPIVEQPILIQPQTVVHSGFENPTGGNVVQGFATPSGNFSSPIVFIEPAPGDSAFAAPDQMVEISTEAVNSGGEEIEEVVAKPGPDPTAEAVTATDSSADGNAMPVEENGANAFGDSIEMDEIEEVAVTVEEMVEPAPSESVFGGAGEAFPETNDRDPFGAAASPEPANVSEKPMFAKEQADEQSPAVVEPESPAVVEPEVEEFPTEEDVFGGAADAPAESKEGPFGPTESESVEPEGDSSDPFGIGTSEATEDPFGADSAPEEVSEDPFGGPAPGENTDDPFGP